MDDLDVERAGFEFFSNFDSANLAKVEYVPPSESVTSFTPSNSNSGRTVPPEIPDVEFNVWTKPDCFGTEFENGNRTWFYFGIRANTPGLLVKLNLVDLNRQGKMYSQGMAPVHRIIPGKPHWERVRDKPTYTVDNNVFTLSFKYRTPENVQSIVYFAFTYPYSYSDLINTLNNIDNRFANVIQLQSKDDIYYYREVLCSTLDGRRIDLLTISSHHNISSEREARLKNLFPEENVPRPFRFIGKKVIFISARVHPGETPSSFVFNGLLNLLLNRDDPVGVQLRRLYVFKLIPMLNPDGVARGHYRTDTRGVNLNRVYLNPSLSLHPSVYAARALIRYYHYGFEKEEVNFESLEELLNVIDNEDEDLSSADDNRQGLNLNNDNKLSKKVSHMSLEEKNKNENNILTEVWCAKCKMNIIRLEDTMPGISNIMPTFNHSNPLFTGKGSCRNCGHSLNKSLSNDAVAEDSTGTNKCEHGDYNLNESGLFMYIDMHGHASKKGIFMYGNHFEEFEKNIECMLLPKIMSLNNHNFHFTACNFTERNMYLRDRRDGLSRAGSGRVAVLKLTGLVRSYTLECNYNTGRLVNTLPSTIRETSSKAVHPLHVPPKYTPHVFEEVGKAIGASILDLTGHNPYTRLPHSQFHTLNGIRDWLRIHCVNEIGETRCTPRFKLKNSSSLHAQGKSLRGVVVKTRSTSAKGPKRINSKKLRSTSVPIERKENIYENREAVSSNAQPSCSKIGTLPRPKSKSFTNMRNKIKKEVPVIKPKPNVIANEKSKSTSNVIAKPVQNLPLPRQKAIRPSQITANKLQTIKEKQPTLKNVKNSENEASATVNKNNSGNNNNNTGDATSRLKLHEICFIKSSEGKRMIAKYRGKGDDDEKAGEDNLIVAWDATSNTPHVFSHKSKASGPEIKPLYTDPGPSKGLFRVHNFAKSTNVKNKRNKRPLRRLAATVEAAPNKTDKLKKRKILKNQTT